MKRRFITPFIAFLVFTFIYSCDNNNKNVKESSTGQYSELIIVAEKPIWNSCVGDSVKKFFSNPIEGMPQAEPQLKIIHLKEDGFSRLLKRHKNILIFTIDSTFESPKYEAFKDVWAAPQRVIKFTAKTTTDFIGIFDLHKNEILNIFDNAELETLQSVLKKNININVADALKKNFNISMSITPDYTIAVNKSNFMWLRKETESIGQGIIIYSAPYKDTSDITANKILLNRDILTKEYIPGPANDSYMKVARSVIKPIEKSILLNKEYAFEIKGLWEVENDFMGGPFISYSFIDKKTGQIITVDGYIYAPNKPKRKFIKEIQAILLSTKFVDQI